MIKFGQKIRTVEGGKRYFVTSDLHFYHNAILRFCPDTRPWQSAEEMNDAIIEHWNSVVGVDDEVLHLGDFSFKAKEATEAILARLNGNITFVLGNHDRPLRDQIGGLNTYDYLEFRFNDTKVCAMHFPISSWNSQSRGSVMIHGHTHGSFQGKGRILDCGWDVNGRIIELQEAIDICLAKDIYCPDHHKIVGE